MKREMNIFKFVEIKKWKKKVNENIRKMPQKEGIPGKLQEITRRRRK